MTRSSIEAERFLLRVKIKGARRPITSESKEHFSMGQNRCAGSSLFPSCLQDRVIEKSIRRPWPIGRRFGAMRHGQIPFNLETSKTVCFLFIRPFFYRTKTKMFPIFFTIWYNTSSHRCYFFYEEGGTQNVPRGTKWKALIWVR